MRRATNGEEVVSGVNEPNVRKGLWEVAKLTLLPGIIFFGKKPEVVSNGQQALEQTLGFGLAARENQVVGEPKRAGDERSFTCRKGVGRRFRGVAIDETIPHEGPLDGINCPADPGIGGRKKPYECD